jgi:two-component system sensor histidine kinase PrrB
MRFPRGVGPPRSLRTQVSLSAAALVMVIIALAGAFIAIRIHVQDRAQLDNDLSTRTTKVSVDAGKLVNDRDDRQDTSGAEAGLLAGSQSLVRVISGNRVISQHGDVPAAPVPLPHGFGYSTVRIGDQDWRSLVQPIQGGGEVQVLDSLAPVDQRLHDNGRIIVIVALAATVITFAGAWLITGLVLAPLQRLRAGAAKISTGHDLTQRLPPVRHPLEVAELSGTLNGMLEGLHTSMLSTRRFTADVGHELRTPLASFGIDLETLRRNPGLPADQRAQMLAAMTVEHARIVGLLDGLQTLARGDAGAIPAVEEIDIAELAVESVNRGRRRHPQVRYLIDYETSRIAWVQGWREGLRTAIENLLDNAAHHGRPDGEIHIQVRALAADLVTVVIDDDGPGIPPELRADMKQRFRRGEQARSSGSGLGLALVEQQAVLHLGVLDLGESPRGGLRAAITLPARFKPSP